MSSNERMIDTQIVARGVRDPRVLEALRSVPREFFVPQEQQTAAFEDSPLPLRCGQTISQPFIVARMTALLAPRESDSVLEIGTGSGYQTAVLSRLVRHVWSAELEPELAAEAAVNLRKLGVSNVTLGTGDGLSLFRREGPFDAILSAAAPITMPDELLEQLADGGRCVIPVGDSQGQNLWLVQRRGEQLLRQKLDPVRFVPLRRMAGDQGLE
jgi:protein-L-isoaspartate(D-aspartate) O-methyltransferase